MEGSEVEGGEKDSSSVVLQGQWPLDAYALARTALIRAPLIKGIL
jgi:hypothetical protein